MGSTGMSTVVLLGDPNQPPPPPLSTVPEPASLALDGRGTARYRSGPPSRPARYLRLKSLYRKRSGPGISACSQSSRLPERFRYSPRTLTTDLSLGRIRCRDRHLRG